MKTGFVKLGKYAKVISGYAFKSKDFVADGIPVLKIANIKHEHVIFDPVQYLPNEFLSIDDKFKVQNGDVMICLTGSHISQPNSVVGRVAMYRHDRVALLNQRAGRIVVSQREKLDKDFLYYYLRQGKVMRDLALNAGGAANQANISPKDVERIELPDLSIDLQRTISKTLKCYDDLIENNKRRITLLEESARQLYKEWFVRFRFPGHEHVKIVDGVPDGWEKGIYGEVSDAVGGGTPSTKVTEYWNDGDITWFVPKDLTQNNSLILLDSGKKITKLGLQKSSAKMLPPNTIMMSSRASIGYFGLYEGDACTNQGFISIVPKRNNTQMYLLHNLMFRKSEIISLAGGTTYKEINKTTFRNIDILLPPDALLNEFQEYASDLLDQVRLLMKQNSNLARARDLLLPKLMNGEIAV